jgi:DNA-binding MarR family transcriptional regulator
MNKIDCPKCNGTGAVYLSTHLQQTLDAIAEGGSTSRELATLLKVNIQAMVNRLVLLEKAMLVYRIRGPHPTGGVEYIWGKTGR